MSNLASSPVRTGPPDKTARKKCYPISGGHQRVRPGPHRTRPEIPETTRAVILPFSSRPNLRSNRPCRPARPPTTSRHEHALSFFFVRRGVLRGVVAGVRSGLSAGGVPAPTPAGLPAILTGAPIPSVVPGKPAIPPVVTPAPETAETAAGSHKTPSAVAPPPAAVAGTAPSSDLALQGLVRQDALDQLDAQTELARRAAVAGNTAEAENAYERLLSLPASGRRQACRAHPDGGVLCRAAPVCQGGRGLRKDPRALPR